ncbi:MAG: pyridoxal phosphate-dependent aminotransferase [Chlorobi bacterium]|nr:pyridoxal phosphate-dependent aminotransferase [Chlorobiota bacterium]
MRLSSKVDKLPYSPIRKLVPFAEQAEKAGKKIYYLNIGQPDLPTPQEAIQFLKDNIPEVIAYSHSAGMEELRRKFQGYYASQVGVDLPLSSFLVTTGASEALIFTFSVLLNSGDEVIIPEPMYANYIGFASVVDATVKPITSKIEEGFALPPINEFEKLITPRTKAIMICNPNNPTGYLYSYDELRQLAELIKKHDLWLIVDEVYREFTFDGKKHISILTFEDLRDRTIVIDSVSKRYSACGARIGLVVSANEQFMDAVLRMAQARLSPPTLGQILSLGLLRLSMEVVMNMVKEYEKRRDVTIEALKQIEGVIVPKPSGAFYTVAELPVDDAEKFSKWLLTDFDYEGETIMFAPAAGFYINKEFGKKQVRIAFVLEADKMERAMRILKEALEQYKSMQP